MRTLLLLLALTAAACGPPDADEELSEYETCPCDEADLDVPADDPWAPDSP